MTIIGEGKRKRTRKAHRCCGCGEVIPTGSPCGWRPECERLAVEER